MLLNYHTKPIGDSPLDYSSNSSKDSGLSFLDCLGSRVEIDLASSTIRTNHKTELRDKAFGFAVLAVFGLEWSRQRSSTAGEVSLPSTSLPNRRLRAPLGISLRSNSHHSRDQKPRKLRNHSRPSYQKIAQLHI